MKKKMGATLLLCGLMTIILGGCSSPSLADKYSEPKGPSSQQGESEGATETLSPLRDYEFVYNKNLSDAGNVMKNAKIFALLESNEIKSYLDISHGPKADEEKYQTDYDGASIEATKLKYEFNNYYFTFYIYNNKTRELVVAALDEIAPGQGTFRYDTEKSVLEIMGLNENYLSREIINGDLHFMWDNTDVIKEICLTNFNEIEKTFEKINIEYGFKPTTIARANSYAGQS